MTNVIPFPGAHTPIDDAEPSDARCAGCRKRVDDVLGDPMHLHVRGARVEVWLCLDCHVKAFKALVRNQAGYIKDLERMLQRDDGAE